MRIPDLDISWARSVRDYTAAARRELSEPAAQVDAALLASSALDWAIAAWALGEELAAVRAGLMQALASLRQVRERAGTELAPPFVVIDDEGAEEQAQVIDESLDSEQRARLAFHLAALLGEAGGEWPGGSSAESAALAAIESSDRAGFLAALHDVLDEHDAPPRDPLSLVSVPAVGLAARALAAGAVTAADLPAHPLLPKDLLTFRRP